MAQIAEAIERSWIPTTINQSVLLLGGLSGVHLIGFTLVLGAVLVSNLRLTGAAFSDRPAVEILASTTPAIVIGLSISVTTGLLMFSTRVQTALESQAFRLKIGLLVGAAVFQLVLTRRLRRSLLSDALLRLAGGLSLALWFGVALAACAFILLE